MRPFSAHVILIGALIISAPAIAQGVGVNTSGSNPDPSAILDITSSDQDVLIPHISAAQRDGMALPGNANMPDFLLPNLLKAVRINRFKTPPWTDPAIGIVRVSEERSISRATGFPPKTFSGIPLTGPLPTKLCATFMTVAAQSEQEAAIIIWRGVRGLSEVC